MNPQKLVTDGANWVNAGVEKFSMAARLAKMHELIERAEEEDVVHGHLGTTIKWLKDQYDRELAFLREQIGDERKRH